MLLDLCQFNVYLLSVMLNKQEQKPVSSRNIFFLLIILVPLALFAWFFISQSLTENKLKGAISELELATGIETQLVDCHNEEFKTVCTANYGLLDYNKAKDMLIKGGYSVRDGYQGSEQGSGDVRARNDSLGISVYGSNVIYPEDALSQEAIGDMKLGFSES